MTKIEATDGTMLDGEDSQYKVAVLLIQQIHRVAEHFDPETGGFIEMCRECGKPWPCLTESIINDCQQEKFVVG